MRTTTIVVRGDSVDAVRETLVQALDSKKDLFVSEVRQRDDGSFEVKVSTTNEDEDDEEIGRASCRERV